MGSTLPHSRFDSGAEDEFALSNGRTIASYVCELALRRKEEIRLKLALAAAEALLREHGLEVGDRLDDPLVRPPDMLDITSLLTARQHEIMALVVAGHASKNIAFDLGISRRTVENHRAAIMKRTGVKSLPALARLAVAAVK